MELAGKVVVVTGGADGIDLFCSNAGISALDGETWWATAAADSSRQAKAGDCGRWLGGMRKLRRQVGFGQSQN